MPRWSARARSAPSSSGSASSRARSASVTSGRRDRLTGASRSRHWLAVLANWRASARAILFFLDGFKLVEVRLGSSENRIELGGRQFPGRIFAPLLRLRSDWSRARLGRCQRLRHLNVFRNRRRRDGATAANHRFASSLRFPVAVRITGNSFPHIMGLIQTIVPALNAHQVMPAFGVRRFPARSLCRTPAPCLHRPPPPTASPRCARSGLVDACWLHQ